MSALSSEVTVLGDEDSGAVLEALARQHDLLRRMLDFLGEAAEPDPFDFRRVEDRSWQEQYDMTRLGLAIGNNPPSRLAAWRRPSEPDAPYLAGLIPEPFEQGLIEHDARQIGSDVDVFTEAWWSSGGHDSGASFRCDLHVFEHLGSRIEVATRPPRASFSCRSNGFHRLQATGGCMWISGCSGKSTVWTGSRL